MENLLCIKSLALDIIWDESCEFIEQVKAHPTVQGKSVNIQGEVFFYQFDMDIPFNGQEREVFEIGDVVYWRSAKDPKKFGILFMYGNTTYGDGTAPRTSSPGVKIGTIADTHLVAEIRDGDIISLGL